MELKPDWERVRERRRRWLVWETRGAMMAYQTGLEKCPDDAALRQSCDEDAKCDQYQVSTAVVPGELSGHLESQRGDEKVFGRSEIRSDA